MQIVLRQLKFYAYHGVLAQEQVIGGHYEIDLVLHIEDCDARKALWHDQLEGTVNYAEVYEVVREEMKHPSALLEHVAACISRVLLRKFRMIRTVQIEVRKCVPPIEGFDGAGVSVRYEGQRELMVWDFDGTIADTAGIIVRTMRIAFRECGLPVPAEEAVRQTIGLPLKQSVRQLSQADEETVQKVTDVYRRVFTDSGDKDVHLFPGILEAMQRQFHNGCFIAIATSRSHESVVNLCRNLGIESYIDAIVACEDVRRPKPDPDPVWELCRLLNAPVERTMVIGDTSFDMGMGRHAGSAHCVGVAWGNHTVEQLTEGGADQIAYTADDL